MKRIFLCIALSIGVLIPSVANGVETSGTLPPDPTTLTQYQMDKYGDKFEISWTTNFKKTGKCKSAQIQFKSKRFLGAPEERSGSNGFYFYSADFKSILQAEGMYSTKLQKKFGRFAFDFFLLDGEGKGGKLPSDVITQCLALDKNFKSPLEIHYSDVNGKVPYEGQLIASISFTIKK